MGLDMYMYRVNKTKHSPEELQTINDSDLLYGDNSDPQNEMFKEFQPLVKYNYLNDYTIFNEVGYWRKVNSLHNYIVKNFQGGVDNCQLTELSKENLEDILNVLETALETKDHSKIPPVSGFFFGSTDVDDYYWKDTEDSIVKIKRILEESDWDKVRIFYQSSW